jgi:hypothetical protein
MTSPTIARTFAAAVLVVAGVAHAAPPEDWDQWYEFTADVIDPRSPLAMDDWSPEAAGAKGWITVDGDKLMLDGSPLRIWGINLTYDHCAPPKDLAEKRAAFYKTLGINSVRLHKYADGGDWAGIMSDDSILEFVPEELDRMDYFVHQLTEAGIYTKLSPNFGIKLQPGDRHRVPWFDEIGKDRNRVDAGHGAIFLSPELQEFQLETLVNILEHTNPYTGLRYADDPAIWCVEFFNEDSVLFYGTNRRLQQLPTLRQQTAERFTAHLLEKYGSEEAWREAWGEAAIFGSGIESEHLLNLMEPDRITGDVEAETLAAGNVVPWGHGWFYDNATRDGDTRALRNRLIDTMNWLITLQDDFYARLEKAVRDTGYKGVLMGSNWQAGNNVPHFHNLRSDAELDIIDRHNYFIGPRQALRRPEVALNKAAMVADPGGTLLSSGMQQVADKPFMLSEWIHEQPSEWTLEGPAIIGAYGMGLNGWDVSYMFQNRDWGEFQDELGVQAWEIMIPQLAGTFPAISRMTIRGDIEEGPLIGSLNVDPAKLLEGEATATTGIRQRGDIKSFESDEVPNDMMAVGRVAVSFGDGPTEAIDPADYLRDGALVSVTEQLRWMPGDDRGGAEGFFTIDTPATLAFVGFAPESALVLGEFVLQPQPGFAGIFITAPGRTQTLADADELILIAMARGRNADVVYDEDESHLLEVGDGPVLLEPVRATIELPDGWELERLTQGGMPTGELIEMDGNRISLDTGRDRTPFYLLRRQ